MKKAILIAAIALTGCANGPRLIGRGVTGNAAFVTVSNVWNDADAMKAATAHCEKYGKIPKATRFQNASATFDCVAP